MRPRVPRSNTRVVALTLLASACAVGACAFLALTFGPLRTQQVVATGWSGAARVAAFAAFVVIAGLGVRDVRHPGSGGWPLVLAAVLPAYIGVAGGVARWLAQTPDGAVGAADAVHWKESLEVAFSAGVLAFVGSACALLVVQIVCTCSYWAALTGEGLGPSLGRDRAGAAVASVAIVLVAIGFACQGPPPHPVATRVSCGNAAWPWWILASAITVAGAVAVPVVMTSRIVDRVGDAQRRAWIARRGVLASAAGASAVLLIILAAAVNVARPFACPSLGAPLSENPLVSTRLAAPLLVLIAASWPFARGKSGAKIRGMWLPAVATAAALAPVVLLESEWLGTAHRVEGKDSAGDSALDDGQVAPGFPCVVRAGQPSITTFDERTSSVIEMDVAISNEMVAPLTVDTIGWWGAQWTIHGGPTTIPAHGTVTLHIYRLLQRSDFSIPFDGSIHVIATRIDVTSEGRRGLLWIPRIDMPVDSTVFAGVAHVADRPL